MTLLEAAKQALEALEILYVDIEGLPVADHNKMITKLRAVIEQAEKAEHPLAQFINSAGINANDMPHVVVEKLEKAMLTAAPQPEGEQ